MAVLGDDLDAARLHHGTDKRVDVIVANFAHESHLFHRLATDFVSLGEH